MTEVADPCEIRLTSPARCDLDRLAPKFIDPVARFLAGPMRENPHRVSKPLTAELAGKHSARVGPAYQIIVVIDDTTRTVYVERITHRADAYRTR